MKKNSALVLSFILVLTLTYCSKERLDEQEKPLNAYGSPENFYNSYRPAEQSFIVNRNGKGPIIGLLGTKIWVDSTLFMYQNGTDITYPFIIKLVELYTPKDMILYNMPTVAGGKLLTTGGEIRIRALKDTTELVLKPGKVYLVNMPNGTDNQMEVFYGKPLGSFTDWSNTPSTAIALDSGFYKMLLPKIGWINADYFYAFPGGKATVTFSSTVDDLTSVAKFLYFDGIKSVMQVYGDTSGEIPVGASVKIVCFAADATGKMFYYTQNITAGATNEIDVTLESVTDQVLLTYLGTL